MGFGDEIMATAEAKALKLKYPNAKIVIGDGKKEYWSPIFNNNPNINRLSDASDTSEIVWLKNHIGSRPYIDYSKSDMDIQMHYKKYSVSPGELYFDAADLEIAHAFINELDTGNKPIAFIEPNVEFGQPKDWGFEKWQSLVDCLKDKIFFIQPVYKNAFVLKDTTTFHSKNFLQGCALLSKADIFIGPEGGLHHAAGAIGIKGVVIFGGRIHPDMMGYDIHSNIYVDLPESPCGMIQNCNHCKESMERISVDNVISEVERFL